jgi:pyruvate oxidase
MLREMTDKTAADVMLHKLKEWGVEYIFGIPGDAINGIMESIRKHGGLKFIQVRHEEAGAFMASAYAKLTGKLAVCMGTAGPGSIHLLNGLYDATMDGAPVVAITGQVESQLIGTHYFQEVNIPALFSDVAVYLTRVTEADQIAQVTSIACRSAHSQHGVAVINVPLDIPDQLVSRKAADLPAVFEPEVPSPQAFDLDRAAVALGGAKKPVILMGRGAQGHGDLVARLAETIGAPIVKTLPAKEILPDDHPFVLGGLGLLGTKPSQETMEACDLLVMVGTSYPYTEYLPRDVTTIQIDNDAERIGLRTKVHIPLVGDSAVTLRELIPRLTLQRNRDWLKDRQGAMADWWRKLEQQETKDTVPINPMRLARAVSDVFPKDAIVAVDVGNVTVWAARNFRAAQHRFVFSSNLASMGCGLPFAIGGQLAYPDRRVVALCGDGGFAMTMADFNTAVKYGLPIVVVVFNNSKLAMIKFEQEVHGHPEFAVDLHNPDFAMYAEACGGVGYRVEQPKEIVPTLEAAIREEKPIIIDAIVDPDVPPMPPKIKPSMASKYIWALFREKVDWSTGRWE